MSILLRNVAGVLGRRHATVMMRKAVIAATACLPFAISPASAQDRFSQPAFDMWLKAAPDRSTLFFEFQSFLSDKSVADIVPAFQLWRTSSSSANCHADAFVIPERADWPHIVATLSYIRDDVVPDIGKVEVVSGYRDAVLNTCSGGAAHSAHREYYALDLVPLNPAITRTTLIAKMCVVHAAEGPALAIGLGFYSGTRFHIDSKSFRRWGPDGHAATSPCHNN